MRVGDPLRSGRTLGDGGGWARGGGGEAESALAELVAQGHGV